MRFLNCAVCWVLAVAAPTSPPAPVRTAVTHVTVIDVRSGLAKPDMTAVLFQGRIESVGPAAAAHVGRSARIIDGRGRYLIPGLWDMHVHEGDNERALRLMLAAGITGVRDMGSDVEKLREARRRLRTGEWTGPRLVFAGPMLEGPPSEAASDTWIVRTPEEATRAVKLLASEGVDFIKVHDNLARDTYRAIADAARTSGLPFAGHVSASTTPLEASNLGQKSIEHLEFVPQPCRVLFEPAGPARSIPAECDDTALRAMLQAFAANGTWLDPTIGSFRYFAPEQWPAIFAGFRALALPIRQSGVRILTGTDQSGYLEDKGDIPGRSLHDELALLVEAGFTPAEVLRAATLNAAVFLGLGDSLGTVEAGKVANLVLLEANPLQDIRNTRRIVAVIVEGRVVGRSTVVQNARRYCRGTGASAPSARAACNGQ